MSQSLIINYGTVGINDALTRFLPITGSISQAQTTEANTEIPIRDSGAFSNGFSYVPTNTITANSTITLRKSRADTTIIMTYSSTQTGAKSSSNSVSFAATDEVDWEVTTTSTAGTLTITITVLGIAFTPNTSTDCISFLGTTAGSSNNDNNINRWTPPNGDILQWFTPEANEKYRARFAFTSQDFYVYVSANARTADTVFSTRKNGAAGAQSVTYATTQTGAKEDTSNSDSIAIGDDFCYQVDTPAGTEIITVHVMSSSCINTSRQFALLASQGVGEAISFNTTTYVAASSDLNLPTTTEINTQFQPSFDFTAKELGVFVTANTIATSPTTVTLRDNGADSPVTVSYSAAQTGLKNDSVNTTSITGGSDEINYKIVTPNTSGSITFTWMGILGETAELLNSSHFLGLLGIGA